MSVKGIVNFEKALIKDDLIDIRNAALSKFLSQAWPRPDDEEWRRTRVIDFGFDDMTVQLSNKPSDHNSQKPKFPEWLGRALDDLSDEKKPLDEDDISVYIDILDTELCPVFKHEKQSGLAIYNLTNGENLFEKSRIPADLATKAMIMLANALENADNRFLSLNLLFSRPVILIHLSKNTLLEQPIILDWQYSDGELCHNSLALVIAEEGSQCTIVEKLSGAQEGLVNHQLISDIHPNAHLESNVISNLADDALCIGHDSHNLNRDARLWQTGAWLGAGLSKIRSTANMNAPGTEAHLDGFYFAKNEQHMDIRSVQNHNSHNAVSRAYYKGVVRDEARTIYQGLIYVSPNAPKTDAYLTNKNMVLNDGARADSIPCLNILTNDVKCSHGSTTGKLPEDQMYYLQTRGFNIIEAKKALIGSYLGEVMDKFPETVRPFIANLALSAIGE